MSATDSMKTGKRKETLEQKLESDLITPLAFIKSHAHTLKRKRIGDENEVELEELEDNNNH